MTREKVTPRAMILAGCLFLGTALAQQKQSSTQAMQNLANGLPPVTSSPKLQTDAERQAALKASGYQEPKIKAPVQTPQQAQTAKADPKKAAEYQKMAQESLKLAGSASSLKEVSEQQALSLLASGRKQISILASQPSEATLEALDKAAAAGASVRVFTNQASMAKVQKHAKLKGYSFNATRMQGLALIDGKVLLLGSFAAGSRYSASNSPVALQSMQEAMDTLAAQAQKK